MPGDSVNPDPSGQYPRPDLPQRPPTQPPRPPYLQQSPGTRQGDPRFIPAWPPVQYPRPLPLQRLPDQPSRSNFHVIVGALLAVLVLGAVVAGFVISAGDHGAASDSDSTSYAAPTKTASSQVSDLPGYVEPSSMAATIESIISCKKMETQTDQLSGGTVSWSGLCASGPKGTFVWFYAFENLPSELTYQSLVDVAYSDTGNYTPVLFGPNWYIKTSNSNLLIKLENSLGGQLV